MQAGFRLTLQPRLALSSWSAASVPECWDAKPLPPCPAVWQPHKPSVGSLSCCYLYHTLLQLFIHGMMSSVLLADHYPSRPNSTLAFGILVAWLFWTYIYIKVIEPVFQNYLSFNSLGSWNVMAAGRPHMQYCPLLDKMRQPLPHTHTCRHTQRKEWVEDPPWGTHYFYHACVSK